MLVFSAVQRTRPKGSDASEFDSFSPSRALPDARARRRSVSRRARPSVHGFLRNAASFLCVPSAFFRLRTFPQVAFVVSLRASSALSKTQHFVRNRARAGRADSSDRAPRSEGGDKARRRVFRTRSVDARPGKSTDARLRQPRAFPHTVGQGAPNGRRSLACTALTWEPPSRASAVRRR